jgi:hypothetical protein
MRRVLRLIAILIVVFGGYWAYYVFAGANPNDPLGVEISKYLPDQAREFACTKLKERFGDIQTPQGCAEFALWAPAPAPAPVEVPLPGDAPETAAP